MIEARTSSAYDLESFDKACSQMIKTIEKVAQSATIETEKNKEIILNSKLVICQTKMPKEVCVSLVNMCNEQNIPIIINPNDPNKLKVTDSENLELINKILQ